MLDDSRFTELAAEEEADDEALSHKQNGNALFAKREYAAAISEYQLGLSLLPSRAAPDPVEPTALDLRATFNANIAACQIKLDAFKEAVESCTLALEDKPDYVKALHRRAQANEKIDTWSSLTHALEDWKKIDNLEDAPAPVKSAAQKSLKILPPILDARKEQETAEMMSKLKEMGNSILGKFGLSTDNFKMTPNGQGGHAMSFQR